MRCNNDAASRLLAAAAESVYLLASSEQHKPSDDAQTQRKQLKPANQRASERAPWRGRACMGLRFALQSPATAVPLPLLMLQRIALMSSLPNLIPDRRVRALNNS